MADIMLHTSNNAGFTCVSNTFIDDFMKDANGEYVKIYLYLLRCLNNDGIEFSIGQLADCLDHTEKDVMRALLYWEKVGLLHLEYTSDNELSGICLVDVNGTGSSFTSVNNAVGLSTATEAVAPAVSSNRQAAVRPSYSADELDAFKEEEAVEDLIFATQTYLGRPLSYSDTNTLLFWYDGLHMSLDLIEYLIETCLSNGHNSFHYMDTVARNWAEDGITTVEAARHSSSSRNNTVYSIMKAFGISGRDLIESELSYIDKWTNTYSFGLDIICEACKRTVVSTNKPSFKYADSILTSWKKSAVKTLDDIGRLDQEFATASVSKLSSANRVRNGSTQGQKPKANNKFHNFSQREYDFAALEKKLLGN
ncbi:MAG: DnaD domain protein [Pseudobutyrivibrio sp.]|nr:DnaD domain protein [Pseudobutyrivibrio sp.]